MQKQDALKNFARSVTPPFLWNIFKRKWGFFGNYKNFNEVPLENDFYARNIIFEKAKKAFAIFERGEAYFERDATPMREKTYNWPIIGLIQSFGKVSVLDFGGGLGSMYYQNKDYIDEHVLTWDIVEQPHYVEFLGERGKIKAHKEIPQKKYDVIILSGVLQYIEKPYDLLEKIKKVGASYIIFDRTPMIKIGDERVTIQKVNPKIYPVDLKAWFLNEQKLIEFMKPYEFQFRFNELPITLENGEGFYEGYLFKKN